MEKTDFGRRPLFKRALQLLVCAAAGALVSIVVLGVFAAVITASGSYTALAKPAIIIAALAGGFVSGIIAAKNLRGRGFLTGAIASAVCALITALFSLIPAASAGTQTGMGLISLAVCVAGGIVGGIIGANISKTQ